MIDVFLKFVNSPFGGLLFGLGCGAITLITIWGFRKPSKVKGVVINGRMG